MLWKFEDSSWEQDDGLKKFKVRELYGQACDTDPVAPLDLLIGAKLHPSSEALCAKGMFPPDFVNCPFCGSVLLEPGSKSDNLWVPPYGAGNGLKLFSIRSLQCTNVELGDVAKKLPLPSRDGHFAFCAAKLGAQQRLLLALNRNVGQLWVFQPGNMRWDLLSGVAGADSLPGWSWSLAVDLTESAICIPTDEGPAWLTIDWASSNIHIDKAVGQSVGGAMSIGKFVLAPVLRGDSFSVVYRKQGDTAWAECSSATDPVSVLPQLRRNTSQEAFLGIPVIDESRHVAYWPCRGGYVRVFGGDSTSGLCWEFKPYETDEYPATALIELGPPYKRGGSRSGFWQLCEDRDHTVRDGIVNKLIKLDGDELADSEIVECGQFLTTGRASFSWSEDFWIDLHRRDSRLGEQKELRIPLLQSDNNGLTLIAKVSPWEGRDELGLFTDIFYNRTLKTSGFVRFAIAGSGLAEKALYAEGVEGVHGKASGSLFRVELNRLPELTVFVYDESFYIYLPESNACFGWSLKLLKG